MVDDLDKTVEFYEKLGFLIKEKETNYAKVYVNWYWMEFVAKDKAEPTVFKKAANLDTANKGSGIFVEVSVSDTDEFYDSLTAKGIKPASKPQDFDWGRREFVVIDPDGYKIVFFTKSK